MCVSSFSSLYVTYVYNLINSLFSGASLGPAPARRLFLRGIFLIRVSLIRPYSCNTRILPYPAVSCRILPYPAVSCRILPYPAVSCRILPYPAVSCRICRILPYPAFPAVSCRMPVTETLTLTLTLTLTVIPTWSFSYW